MATTNISSSGVLGFNDTTGAVQLPSGTTAQRPGSPSNGEMRYNTTDNKVEYYDGSSWIQFSLVSLPPSVTTLAATSVTDTTMTLNGNLSDLGGASTGTVGFYFGTSTNYASNTKYTVSTTASTGAFSYNATGLTGAVDYYINAFAINDGGETVGSQVSQATPFVPQFIATSTSTYYGKSSGNAYPDISLQTQFYNPTTTAYETADYYATGNGTTASGYSYFYGPAPHILNGCRGAEYQQPYNVSYWGGAPTCQPRLRSISNTTNRFIGGTYFQYYTTSVGAVLNTQNPSGKSLTNRVFSVQGGFSGSSGTSNTGQMVSTVTNDGGQNSGQSGYLVHEFDLT